MDHALCIIHHVIGSLSDSTPCWRYRVPRHGTAWHGLVKHKHRETINKRNVARMPRHVSVLPLKPNGGKMSPSLSPSIPSSLSFFLASWPRRSVPILSPFWFTRVTPSALDHGTASSGLFSDLSSTLEKKNRTTTFRFNPSTYHVYAYTLRNPYGDTATCSSDITPNCLAYL